MHWMKRAITYFSRTERVLWGLSASLIVLSFCIFDRENYLTLTASLIGVTSLIFSAKGNSFGQLLMVLFSLLCGVFDQRYLRICELAEHENKTKRRVKEDLVNQPRRGVFGSAVSPKYRVFARARGKKKKLQGGGRKNGKVGFGIYSKKRQKTNF